MGNCGKSSPGAVAEPQAAPPSVSHPAFECTICRMQFNLQQNVPMVLAQCGHTLCKRCLQHLPKSSCPMDNTRIEKSKAKKNYSLLDFIDTTKKTIPAVEFTSGTEVMCNKKKHKTIWSNQSRACQRCKKVGSCFHCPSCKDFAVCAGCMGYRWPVACCFNSHMTRWSGKQSTCHKCKHSNHGWRCGNNDKQECGYSFCTVCADTRLVPQSCPNGHRTLWSRKTDACTKCDRRDSSGSKCVECSFVLCETCGPQTHTQLGKCPNNHALRWLKKSNLSCQRCNISSAGYECGDCQYFLCTKCHGLNTTSQICPNRHNLKYQGVMGNGCCNPNHITKGRDGFVCEICDFRICRNCRQIKPYSKWCLLQHQMKWTIWTPPDDSQNLSNNNMCTECQTTLKNGWSCTPCGVLFCDKCVQTPLTKTQNCPNQHKKEWRNTKRECLICGPPLTTGFGCYKGCGLFVCYLCEGLDYRKSFKCPNKHELKFTQTAVECIVCSKFKKGWGCRECDFHVCMNCVKHKLNRVNCPNYHPQKVVAEVLCCQKCGEYRDECYACEDRCVVVCDQCLKKK